MGEQWKNGDEVTWNRAGPHDPPDFVRGFYIGECPGPWGHPASRVVVARDDGVGCGPELVWVAAEDLRPLPASPPLLEDVLRGRFEAYDWMEPDRYTADVLRWLRTAYLPDHPDATIGALLGGGDDGGR